MAGTPCPRTIIAQIISSKKWSSVRIGRKKAKRREREEKERKNDKKLPRYMTGKDERITFYSLYFFKLNVFSVFIKKKNYIYYVNC